MALFARNPFDSGAAGATLVTNTTATTGIFYAIQVVQDAVFASITGNLTGFSGSPLTTTTFPAGTVIYGQFTALQLTSGRVIAYSA
jgi:hypothetical protein